MKMSKTRRTSIVVGVLFLVAYVGVFLGGGIAGQVLDSSAYPANLTESGSTAVWGLLLEVILNDAVVIGIGVLLFPILRRFGEGIALAYAGARLTEALLLIVSKIGILTTVGLSRAGTDAGGLLEFLGDAALQMRYWSGKLSTVFFLVGAAIFYVVLFRSRLAPRFISIWGLVAVVSLTIANVANVPDLTQSFQPAMLLYFPIVVSELLVAVWLIAKGFRESDGSTA